MAVTSRRYPQLPLLPGPPARRARVAVGGGTDRLGAEVARKAAALSYAPPPLLAVAWFLSVSGRLLSVLDVRVYSRPTLVGSNAEILRAAYYYALRSSG